MAPTAGVGKVPKILDSICLIRLRHQSPDVAVRPIQSVLGLVPSPWPVQGRTGMLASSLAMTQKLVFAVGLYLAYLL
jgi:hypothetical protein